MLTDDEQLANFLTLNGLLDPSQIEPLRAQADELHQTLYLTVMVSGLVNESQLVSMVSSTLDIPSVLLTDYVGEPDVLRMIPAELSRRKGVLPVGIDAVDGVPHLYVAMANPHDHETLDVLRQGVHMPIIPLLAGPSDVLDAIRRNVGTAEYGTGASEAISDDDYDLGAEALIEEELIEGVEILDDSVLPLAEPSPLVLGNDEGALEDMFAAFSEETEDVISALSMIDDIPKERHVAVTPPSSMGIQSDEGAARGPRELRRRPIAVAVPVAEPPPEDRFDKTGLGVPTRGLSGSFRRVGRGTGAENEVVTAVRPAPLAAAGTSRPAEPGEWQKAPAPVLARALAQLLLDRGVFSEQELVEEVRRQKLPR